MIDDHQNLGFVYALFLRCESRVIDNRCNIERIHNSRMKKAFCQQSVLESILPVAETNIIIKQT